MLKKYIDIKVLGKVYNWNIRYISFTVSYSFRSKQNRLNSTDFLSLASGFKKYRDTVNSVF